MLKLKPPDVKNRLLEKTLMLGKTEGGRRSGRQRMRRRAAVRGVTKRQTQLGDFTFFFTNRDVVSLSSTCWEARFQQPPLP